MIEIFSHYASVSPRAFRGLARTTPDAFYDLTSALQNTKVRVRCALKKLERWRPWRSPDSTDPEMALGKVWGYAVRLLRQ